MYNVYVIPMYFFLLLFVQILATSTGSWAVGSGEELKKKNLLQGLPYIEVGLAKKTARKKKKTVFESVGLRLSN